MEQSGSNSAGTTRELPRGRYSARLDDKSRLKLPADFVQFFTKLPESKMFLTSLDRRIASLYPISEWRSNEKFFDEFQADPDAANRIAFNANDLGADVEMDGQGRITVHPDLRRELAMEGTELHLIANKGHLQIMTEALYQEHKRASLSNTAADLTVLRKAGLR